MANNKFEENQRFKQKWTYLIYALFTGLSGLFIYADIQQIIFGKAFGAKPAPNIVLIIVTIVLLTIVLIFYFARLQTIINKEYVCFRWTPFKRSFNKISWHDIVNAEVVKYDFAGFGLRFTSHGAENNVAGNTGLQLTLQTGKKIVIGTQKEKELSAFLKELKEDEAWAIKGQDPNKIAH